MKPEMQEEIEKFILAVNHAICIGDRDFLQSHTTDDFKWNIIGSKVISGQKALEEVMREMDSHRPLDIDVKELMIKRNSVAVQGEVTGRNRSGQKKTFAFCDIFDLQHSVKIKIKSLTSYMVDISKHKNYR